MRPVALLSDFGTDDHYDGVLHAVLVRLAPLAPRLDLTHAVPPGDVWTASFLLRVAWPHLPEDAVVLAVVDPGVGTERRAVAVRSGDRWLVVPDNGLAAAPGEAAEVVVLDWRRMGLPQPSATFHGRDLFAPAAAMLARGDAAADLGAAADPATLVACPLPEPERTDHGARGVVLHADRFGNVVTSLPAEWAPAGARLRLADRVIDRRVTSYGAAPAGVPVLLEGSSGLLEVAVANASAAAALGVGRGDAVVLEAG